MFIRSASNERGNLYQEEFFGDDVDHAKSTKILLCPINENANDVQNYEINLIFYLEKS